MKIVYLPVIQRKSARFLFAQKPDFDALNQNIAIRWVTSKRAPGVVINGIGEKTRTPPKGEQIFERSSKKKKQRRCIETINNKSNND